MEFFHNKLPPQHDAVACVDGSPVSLLLRGVVMAHCFLFILPSAHLLRGPMDHLSLLTTENRTDRNTCIQAIPLLE